MSIIRIDGNTRIRIVGNTFTGGSMTVSDKEPTEPYIRQADPWPPGVENPRIFAIGGPGAERLAGNRYTKAEAEWTLDYLKEAKKAKKGEN